MSVVVEKLKAALEQREHEQEQIRKAAEQMRKAAEYEQIRKAMRKAAKQVQIRKAAKYEAEQEQMRKAAEQEYKEILKSADPPLEFLEFPVNGGKTLLSINDKGEVIYERIYIEACLDQTQYDRLQDPSGFENSRFPGGRFYCKQGEKLKVRVRAHFLCPLITYSVNLVFINAGTKVCNTLHYKLNGEKKCCMVYNTYKTEDGWFVVPLYQFTSDYKTADFEIEFEGFRSGCELQVAGFEFQTLEETVELHDQGLEECQDIVKAASQSLFYKSVEDLKELVSVGFHINNHQTWFSLNENGEHCEMLSIAQCLISHEGGSFYNNSDMYPRFPSGIYRTNYKGFKVHIRTQFLTPSIRYTVNLVFCKDRHSEKQKYVALRYKLEGGTETSIVYLANETKDELSFVVELYQFTSQGRTFDLEIVFEDHKDNLKVEGILFQPLDKVEHKQALEDEEVSNGSLQWTMKEKEKDSGKKLLKWFHVDKGQKTIEMGYAVDINGKKCLMFSARGVIETEGLSFKCLPESRFQEVAVVTNYRFKIVKEIKCDALTPETTYACYLVYKSTEDQPLLRNGSAESYIYLVSPPETPIIGQKLDQNTHSPLNRPKLNAVPRQRSDGWMEVKVREYQTTSSTETIDIDILLWNPNTDSLSGLIIESIELRPIAAHSV